MFADTQAKDAATKLNDTEKQKKKKFADAYQDEDADITLVSSDDVSFKVHGYHLMSASPVFAHMLKASENESKIDLTDRDIETAQVLRLFLDFVTTGHLKVVSNRANISAHTKLISFLSKYDCKATLRHLRFACQSLIKPEGSAINDVIFILAAHLDDRATAEQAIRYIGGWKWTSGGDQISDFVEGCGVLDLSSLKHAHYLLVPPLYAHALLRASKKRASETNSRAGWAEVADEFKRLMAGHPAI